MEARRLIYLTSIVLIEKAIVAIKMVNPLMKISLYFLIVLLLTGCSVQNTRLKLVNLSHVSKQQAYDSYKSYSVLSSQPGRIIDGAAKNRWSFGDAFYRLHFSSTFDLNKKQTPDVFFTAHYLKDCASKRKIRIFDILNSKSGNYYVFFPAQELHKGQVNTDIHKNPINLCFSIKQESMSGLKLRSNILIISKETLK